MTILCDTFGKTAIGCERSTNEDQFLIANLRKMLVLEQASLALQDGSWLWGAGARHLFVVADGVACSPAGSEASAVATQTVANYVLNTMPWFYLLREDEEDDLVGQLEQAMERCHRTVETMGERTSNFGTPATTMTLAYVLWPRLYVVHVGHSRCYLQRADELHQLTTDHTYAQRLVEEGAIEPKNVSASPLRKRLWNTLGGDEDQVNAEVHRVVLHRDDTLLLCTDGVTRHLSDETISTVLQEQSTASTAVHELVKKSVEGGGADNITAVVARFPESLDS